MRYIALIGSVVGLAASAAFGAHAKVNVAGANPGELRVSYSAAGVGTTNVFGTSAGAVNLFSDAGNGTFQSFCLERNEGLQNNLRFTIDAQAIAGGIGGQDVNVNYDSGYGSFANTAGDTLHANTQWLFYAFRNGTLTNYFANRATRQVDLQNLLWFLEGEAPGFVHNANTTGWLADANLANGGAGPKPWLTQVRVLNVFVTRFTDAPNETPIGTNGTPLWRQSLLTLIPLPSGAGLAFGGLGLMAIRRRR